MRLGDLFVMRKVSVVVRAPAGSTFMVRFRVVKSICCISPDWAVNVTIAGEFVKAGRFSFV